jgi:hypothetical protein
LAEFERYEGEFNEGFKEGRGILYFYKGDIYEGEFLRVS